MPPALKEHDGNGNKLTIPGWFVRLNLIVVPLLSAVMFPLIGWMIFNVLDNRDRVRQLESQVIENSRLLHEVSNEQRRRTERVYPK